MLKIATDSCSNLSAAEAKALGVELIPLTIVFGTESYLDDPTARQSTGPGRDPDVHAHRCAL